VTMAIAPDQSGSGPARAVAVAETPLGYRIAKRSLDLVVAAAGLVVISPVLAGFALAIRLESSGPILFRQERVGLGGRRFVMLKLRSMHASADEELHRAHVQELIRGGSAHEPRAGDRTWLPITADARVTRIGSFLRRTHIDELPQLVNVLRGEMSLVGPRPPIPYEVDVYEPWQLRRLSVPPGLTGLWQANGWGRLGFEDGVRLDLEYVDTRSFGTDLRLLGRTLWQLVSGRQF